MVFIFYYLHISLIYNKQRVISPAEPPAGFRILQEQASNPMWKHRSPQQYCPSARSKACIKQTAPLSISGCFIYLASGKNVSTGIKFPKITGLIFPV
jgi:hypothetical protein